MLAYMRALLLARTYCSVDVNVVEDVPSSPESGTQSGGLTEAMTNVSTEVKAGSAFYSAVQVGDKLGVDDEVVLVSSKGATPALNVTRSQDSTTGVAHSVGATAMVLDRARTAEGRVYDDAAVEFNRDFPAEGLVQISASSSQNYYLLTTHVSAWDPQTYSVLWVRPGTTPDVQPLDRRYWSQESGLVGGVPVDYLVYGGQSTFQVSYSFPWVVLPPTCNVPDRLIPILANLIASKMAFAAAGYFVRKTEQAARKALSVNYKDIRDGYLAQAKELRARYDGAKRAVEGAPTAIVNLDSGFGGIGRNSGRRVILRRERY